jgi:ParB-like chromosome segregation protein Spo0J
MSIDLAEIPLASITVGDRFRQDLGDVPALAESIATRGLLQPIVVSTEHVLVIGRRRLAACAHLGWEVIPALVLDLDDPLAAEHDENVQRKDFTPSEKVAIGLAIEEREKKKAEERKHEGQKSGGRGKKKLPGNLPESLEEGQSRDLVATRVGWSGKTYEKAKAVVDAAKRDSDYAGLIETMDKSGNVDSAYRQLPEHLRLKDPAPTKPPRKRKSMPVSRMTLLLDRCIEKILRDVPSLSDDDFAHLQNMLQHYSRLLEVERKADGDGSTDSVC